jgi:hypothetical protein
VKFGDHDVTRLIVGGNPFRGNSHFSPDLDREMREYHTVNHVVQTLLRAEECGINTMQSRGDDIIFDMVRAYREAGGTMQWIVQTASEKPDLFENIREIAALDPIAIYWHGSRTDRMWKEGRIQELDPYLQAIRSTGKLVGVASHMPHVLHWIEDRGWDVDFYMACFYNLAKVERDSMLVTGRSVAEPFDDEDREVAIEFIQSTDKPCIAYKVLAASRKCGSEAELRDAFQYAYDHIKPGDVVDVGVFQKHSDQLSQNAQIVRDILDGRTADQAGRPAISEAARL